MDPVCEKKLCLKLHYPKPERINQSTVKKQFEINMGDWRKNVGVQPLRVSLEQSRINIPFSSICSKELEENDNSKNKDKCRLF